MKGAPEWYLGAARCSICKLVIVVSVTSAGLVRTVVSLSHCGCDDPGSIPGLDRYYKFCRVSSCSWLGMQQLRAMWLLLFLSVGRYSWSRKEQKKGQNLCFLQRHKASIALPSNAWCLHLLTLRYRHKINVWAVLSVNTRRDCRCNSWSSTMVGIIEFSKKGEKYSVPKYGTEFCSCMVWNSLH